MLPFRKTREACKKLLKKPATQPLRRPGPQSTQSRCGPTEPPFCFWLGQVFPRGEGGGERYSERTEEVGLMWPH